MNEINREEAKKAIKIECQCEICIQKENEYHRVIDALCDRHERQVAVFMGRISAMIEEIPLQEREKHEALIAKLIKLQFIDTVNFA